jgi:hypothetical protein
MLRICILACVPWMSHSYASWMPCYVDLDPFEVVMNYAILRPDQSPYQVQVEVMEVKSSTTPQTSAQSEASWTTDFTFDPSTVTTLQARLRIPEPLMHYPEVQYVIETTTGASFTRPTMCRGQRAHGRNFFDAVTLVVDGPQAPAQITLTAAWATGHSPVSLTLPTLLTKGDGSNTSSSSSSTTVDASAITEEGEDDKVEEESEDDDDSEEEEEVEEGEESGEDEDYEEENDRVQDEL